MEILEEKKLLPKFESHIDDIILAFDEELRPVANQLATALRIKASTTLIFGLCTQISFSLSLSLFVSSFILILCLINN